MNEEEFINNATDILVNKGLSQEQANAIANLTVLLENNL